jgi:hypothetical protein
MPTELLYRNLLENIKLEFKEMWHGAINWNELAWFQWQTFLGYDSVQSGTWIPTFQKKVLALSLG